MTRVKALTVFPAVWGVAFLAFDSAFQGTAQYGTFLRAEVEAVKILTLFGSWAAAAAFDRGDYLRRAWFLIGLCMALLLLRDLTLFIPALAALGETGLLVLRAVLVTAANVSQIAGTWMLARAWKVGGLSFGVGEGAERSIVVGAAVLAAVFAGPSVWTSGARLWAGQLDAMAGFASSVGDTVSLVLIAPLLLTAIALRGGLLGRVWALLAASYLCWLFYDATAVLGPALGFTPAAVRTGGELFRALGCTLGFAAGMVQRQAVLDLRRGDARRVAA